MATLAFVYSIDCLGRLFGLVGPRDTPYAFSCWHFAGVPLFSYGRLRRAEHGGGWEFVYQRLFLFWERVVPLQAKELTVGTARSTHT